MFRKLIVAALVVACGFGMMPVKSTHASGQARAAFEGKSNIVVGAQKRTGRISYSVQFDLGEDATLIEIAPAGTEAWTTFVNQDQANALVMSGNIGYFSQVVYNTNVYDFRVNGVVWRNIELKNDRLIVLGYDYEPIVVSVQDFYRVK